MAKSKKNATVADAQIVMQLYDLRRESEMRKARKFYAEAPLNTYEDVQKIALAYGSQENAWVRMVLTYWENAASLVLRGVVNKELFFDWNSEIIFTFARIRPFLERMRKEGDSPEFLANTEKLLSSTPELRKKVKMMEERIAKYAAMRAAAKQAAATAKAS